MPEQTAPSQVQPAYVHIRTLGRFAVEVEAKPLRFGLKAQKKPLALLKVLVALGCHEVSVERITDALWPEAGGDQAYGAFTSTLSRLRKLIGGDSLVLTGGRLTLVPGRCWVDTVALAATLDAALQAATAAEAARAWQQTEQALALYRGPFLEGESDPPEVLAARGKLHSGLLRCLQQLGEFFDRAGTPERTIQVCQRGVEIDPLAERLYQDLMRGLQRQGRLAEAVAAYERCREALRTRMQCEPAPETQALHRQLVATQRQRSGAPATPTASVPDAGAPPSPIEDAARQGPPRQAPQGQAPSGLAGPGVPPAGAERRHVTVLDCQLVGAPALAARLDPEEMREVLRAYQEACGQAIARFGGYEAQALGGRVVAYFGYPLAHEDDAERAVRAALDIAPAVARLQTPADRTLAARVGIATGLVVAEGLVNASGAQDQSLSGDAPHLADGLQSLAQPGGVVVSSATRRLLGEVFTLRELGWHELQGFNAPAQAWGVEGVRSAESRFEAMRSAARSGFAGREEEIGLLLDRRKLAWQGRGQVVLIAGEAGIGKSRLAAVFREHLGSEPLTRLQFQCSPYHSGSPLSPFIAQMERAAGFRPDDTPAQRLDKLEAALVMDEGPPKAAVPLLAAMLGLSTEGRYPPLKLSPEEQRRQTLQALLDQMEAFARRQPLLLVFEDAQWADASSLEFLNLGMERIRNLPVLGIITYRPEYTPPWIGLDHVSAIALGPLDRRHAGAIVRHIAGDRPLPPEVLEQIVAKTDGIPLFVEELTKTVLESGLLVEDPSGYRLPGPLLALAIPATLQDSLMARLDRMATVKEIAQIAAAIGREFSYPLLNAVAGRSEAALQAGLAELQLAGLVYRRTAMPDAVYVFKHALVRDAAYESQLKSRRQALHCALAEALRDRFPALAGAEPEVVAQHFTLAGMPQQAFEWWGKAGERALRRSAYAEAIAHLGKALGIAERFPDAPPLRLLRLRLQIAQGNALIAARGWAAPETAAAFARAQELAAGIEDRSKVVPVYFGVWAGNFVRAELEPMRQLSEAFFRETEANPASPEAGIAHHLVAMTAWFQGDYVATTRHLEPLVTAYDPTKNHPLRSRYGADLGAIALGNFALTVWPMGKIDRAHRLHEESIALAQQSGHVHTLTFARAQKMVFDAMRGDPAAEKIQVDAFLPLARAHGMALWVAYGTAFQGWVRWAAGDREGGKLGLRQGMAQWQELGGYLFLPLMRKLLAEAEAGEGQMEAGVAILDGALAETQRNGQRWYDAELHRARGELLARGDLLARQESRIEEAEAAFLRAREIARSQQTRTFELRAALSLARLYRRARRDAEARETLSPMVAGFGDSGALPDMAEAVSVVEELGTLPRK